MKRKINLLALFSLALVATGCCAWSDHCHRGPHHYQDQAPSSNPAPEQPAPQTEP